jgi:hypothetical protein
MQEGVILYPNPGKDVFTILLPEKGGQTQLVVYNTVGKMVWSGAFQDQQKIKVSLAGFSPGLYLFQVLYAGKIYASKVLRH